jgi:hypothetical protein
LAGRDRFHRWRPVLRYSKRNGSRTQCHSSRPAPSAIGRFRATGRQIATPTAGGDLLPAALPADALDDRIAIVGIAGSGKTYAAKGFVERLLDSGARM